jgi:hypothetical protein
MTSLNEHPAAGGTASGMSENLFSGDASDIAPAAPENQPSDPAPAIDWPAIRAAVEDGSLSIREIARRHGVSDTAVRKRAKLEGWQGSQSSSQKAEAPAANPPPPPPRTAAQTDDLKFRWDRDTECVVTSIQLAIAVYRNPNDRIVIRQERDWNEDQDTFVLVAPEHVPALIRRLQGVLDGED